ncbi:hypothetical protein, partial [Paenibacillus forsythiae]|uniref:hypothetical protein n=1 Tax=Paenibacillus forsythiae TaxID=365616 RepID=UPI000563E5F0
MKIAGMKARLWILPRKDAADFFNLGRKRLAHFVYKVIGYTQALLDLLVDLMGCVQSKQVLIINCADAVCNVNQSDFVEILS